MYMIENVGSFLMIFESCMKSCCVLLRTQYISQSMLEGQGWHMSAGITLVFPSQWNGMNGILMTMIICNLKVQQKVKDMRV